MHSNTALVTFQHSSPFDTIRQLDETGREFWSARDLQGPLGYVKWERFEETIERAIIACQNSGYNSADHFPGAGKMVGIGSGVAREVNDYKLTRYASYLTAMNGDPRKPEIAAAQTYFAIKTREAEMAEMEAAEVALVTNPEALEWKIKYQHAELRRLKTLRSYSQLKRRVLPQAQEPVQPQDMETSLVQFLTEHCAERFTASELRQYGPHKCRVHSSSQLASMLGALVDAGTVKEEWIERKTAPRFYVD